MPLKLNLQFCILGNSSSAVLDGTATLTLLKLGEDYTVTMPYAHVKGFFISFHSFVFNVGSPIQFYSYKIFYKILVFRIEEIFCSSFH